MKTSELRINNWVLWKGPLHDENALVLAISKEELIFKCGDSALITECEPIQLTEEWLLKFGFENWDKNKWVDSNSVLTISKNDDNFSCLINQRDVDILYVHQLQNLYFALTGKELTLKDNL
jgi:hypothetical protein